MTDSIEKRLQDFKAAGGIDQHALTVADINRKLREARKYGMPGADITTGGPAGLRALAGIKMTTEGKVGFLQHHLGPGNVTAKGEHVFYRQPEGGGWILFDEERITARDIADWSGAAIETVPALVAGFFTANPLAAAAGDAAGNLARQGISAVMPGDDKLSPGGRAVQAGTAGVVGGVVQGGTNLFFKGADKAANAGLRRTLGAESRKNYDKGLAVTGATGTRATHGQLSGNTDALLVEAVLRQYPGSADLWEKFSMRNLKRLWGHMGSLAKKHGPIADAAAAGTQMQSAYKLYLNKLQTNRRHMADYLSRQIHAADPGAAIMPTANFQAAVRDIIADTRVAFEGVDNLAVKKHLQGWLDQLNGSPRIGIIEFKNSLQNFTKAAHGTGSIVKDLQDPKVDRAIAGKLKHAMLADLDAAVTSGHGLAAPAAEKLAVFRDTYRALSQDIGNATELALAGVVDAPPETLVNKIVSAGGWQPSQIRQVMKTIELTDPGAAESLRRASLEALMAKTRPAGSGVQGLEHAEVSPAKIITVARSHDKKIRALLDDRKAYRDWLQVVAAAKMLNDRGLAGISPTSRLGWYKEMIGTFVGAGRRFNPVAMTQAFASLFAPRRLTQVLLSPTARQQLPTLLKTGNSVKAVTAAILKIQASLKRDDYLEGLRQEKNPVADPAHQDGPAPVGPDGNQQPGGQGLIPGKF